MKFGPVRLLAGAPNGRKVNIANRVGIAIAKPGGTSARIRFANTKNRTPEIIVVFRFPNRHCGIGHGDVYQCQQARELNGAQSPLVGNLHRDLIVESRRRAETWGAIIRPESADERLLFRALRAYDSVATQVFHLVVRSRVIRACHVGRRRRAELTRRVDYKRNALAPVRAERERNQADWILPPVAGLIARKIIDANVRLGNLRTIIETHGQDGCSRPLPQIDPVCSLLRVPDGSQIFCEVAHQKSPFAMETSPPACRARPG